jgi:hypothetical protein
MSQRSHRSQGSQVRRPSNRTTEDWPSAARVLEEGYSSLRLEATLLLEEIRAITASGPISKDDVEVLQNLEAITFGRVSAAVSLPQPLSVRELARSVSQSVDRAQDLIFADFEDMINWLTSQNPSMDTDAIRERLVKRKNILEAALPESMQHLSAAALTRIERDRLGKKYVNSETMFGDAIEDILQEKFFVTEDNYAWDMSELSQALSVNDGIMRNPLSKELFSESDIRNILAHPLGQSLKPIRLAQNDLKKGVRSATIDIIETLARTMLDDQSQDAAPSLKGIDEFLAYVASLPDNEQDTIQKLKIPGKDSHTGQAFDYTVGESVRDGKANVTCFHKVSAALCQCFASREADADTEQVGDFLSQAATYLKIQ